MSNNIFFSKRKNERGNILFLILIAAALFAALSYVIAQSTRSGGGDAQREKARLAASNIHNQVTAVRTAVGRLLLRGCGADQLNFENPLDTVHVNPLAPIDDSCDIFATAGGGVIPRAVEASSVTGDNRFTFSGSSVITNIGSTCATPECADLTMNLSGVSQAVCLALNDTNGVTLSIANLPTDTQSICPYEGTFDCNGNGTPEVVFTDPELDGRASYCYNDTVKGLTFTYVILER